MQITKQADYAIRTMVELGIDTKVLLSTKEIANKHDIPSPFLNKIVQMLSKAGLIITTRGAQGGIRLAVEPENITLRHIIEAVDGPIIVNRCLLGQGICDRQPACAAHKALGRAKKVFLEELERTTVADLVKETSIQ